MANTTIDLFNLVPVKQRELEIGKPVPWPIYDSHGNLLLAEGVIIESQAQVEGLIGSGFIDDARWEMQPKKSTAGSILIGNKSSHQKTSVREPKPDKEVLMDMDDVKWIVRETLYLQSVDNSAVRYSVRLIGYEKNRTVFVTAPMADGKFEFIRDGQAFVVRAFSGKKAFAFMCTAVKSVHTPHPYLLLSYPKQVRCTVVRRGIRAQVKIIAALTLENPERAAAATLLDLSTGGTSCVMKEVFGANGDVVRIKFKVHVADNDEYLNLKAVLRSVFPSENGDGIKHGFEFVDVTIHEKLILSAYVHQTIVEAQ